MKLMTAILVVGMVAGSVWAQSTAPKAKDAQATPKKPAASQAIAAKPAPAKSVVVAKPAAVQVKPAVSTAKPNAVPVKANAAAAKPIVVPAKAPVSKVTVQAVPAVKKTGPVARPIVVSKPAALKPAPVAKSSAPVKEAKPAESGTKPEEPVSVENQKSADPAKNERSKVISASGRRDPFVSPVVSSSATGSGCSVGKRCLSVGQINLKGVVKSETGMIAVVVNAMDKAYFLRENDPVFDGYVLKITTDSIVFKETVQDKLGKPFTREVTKKLTTPAV